MSEDRVQALLLRELATEFSREVGPDVVYALFVDWRDGQPRSYLSNGLRREVVKGLREWLDRSVQDEVSTADPDGTVPPLQVKCDKLGQELTEEDVDVVLLLFEPGLVSWYSSMPNGRRLVELFVKREEGRS